MSLKMDKYDMLSQDSQFDAANPCRSALAAVLPDRFGKKHDN